MKIRIDGNPDSENPNLRWIFDSSMPTAEVPKNGLIVKIRIRICAGYSIRRCQDRRSECLDLRKSGYEKFGLASEIQLVDTKTDVRKNVLIAKLRIYGNLDTVIRLKFLK